MHDKYLVFLAGLVLLVVATGSIVYSALLTIDSHTLSDIFTKEISRKGLSSTPASFTGVRVLPGFPTARIDVIKQDFVNNTRVYFYSEIKDFNIQLAAYNPRSTNIINDNTLLESIMGKYYKTALDLLYYALPTLAEGIPIGSYDELKPNYIKSLNIPPYPEIRILKPKLLLVLVGPSNGAETSDPIIIYYFTLEVTGKDYHDNVIRVLMVLSVVLDTSGMIYGENTVGLSAYYVYGASVATGTYIPYLAVYAFMGLVVSGVVVYIEIDEDYKYYILLLVLFIAQLFGFLLTLILSGTPIASILDIIISLNQWFVILFLFWSLPYLLLAYTFNSSKELEDVSPGKVAVEGIIFALSLILLIMLSINPAGTVTYLIATMGVEALYLYILLLIGLSMFIGLTLGGLWARLIKIRSLVGTYRR